jgi:phosphoglucosamine mutase
MGKLFGTDGIRGEANQYPMDAAMVLSVGQAVGHLLKKGTRRRAIMVGKDTRISGDMLENALAAGITSMGADPYLVGTLPTPGIAYLTKHDRADAGIVISASHNPYQDNGIKVFSHNGFKLSDQQEEMLEEHILGGRLADHVPASADIGRTVRVEDAGPRYAAFLTDTFPGDLSMKGMKIVLDTANGATFKVAPETFDQLGADITVMNDTPDGLNINADCGSQHTDGLEQQVRDSGATIGLAFDGDGDRLIAVDEKGYRLTGDQILLICAKGLKDRNELENNLLVSTVMSNLGLRVACKRYGIDHHASKVGDRHVLVAMQRHTAVLGGEESGHMIFLKHHTTGDGILAAIQLVAAVLREDRPLSELASLMDIYPQVLINVEVAHKPEISTLPPVVAAIKQIETELGEEGRVLVRYSGTQNLCRVMVEGPSEDMTERYCRQIAEAVKSAVG